MSNGTTLDEARRLAAEAGLSGLDEAQLRQLAKAADAARARRAALPSAELAPGDEPAHVYRLPHGAPR